MKILQVTDKKPSETESRVMKDNGIFMESLSPTPLSALTALKIAKAADKKEAQIVEVYRQEDAIAAISAKKIAKAQNFKIVYYVMPNSAVPMHVHNEVIKNVDCWIFASERLKEKYPQELKNSNVLQPVAIQKNEIIQNNINKTPLTIAWIGEIRNTDMLKKALNSIDEGRGKFKLIICGSGKARDVMPAVRYARSLDHASDIKWIGEEYNKAEAIANCQAAVRTDADLTILETEILQSGRAVISAEEINSFIENPYIFKETENYSPENYLSKYKAIMLKA